MNDYEPESPIQAELVRLETFREEDAEIDSILCFTGYRTADGSIVKHGRISDSERTACFGMQAKTSTASVTELRVITTRTGKLSQ